MKQAYAIAYVKLHESATRSRSKEHKRALNHLIGTSIWCEGAIQLFHAVWLSDLDLGKRFALCWTHLVHSKIFIGVAGIA